jgi:uncharacterized protein
VRIENDFEVPAAPPETYGLLVDLERVAACIPGGEVGARGEDGSHPATITVKVGPMQMNYRGKVRISEQDDTARRAVLVADVREQRGQGSAKATMTMAVAGGGTGSTVETVTDVRLTGRAAQMGRGMVDDVAKRLVADMAGCIAGRLGPAEAGADSGAGGPGEGAGAGGPGEGAGAGANRPANAGGAPERAKPIGGLQLMAGVFWERLKRIFRRREGENHA